VSTSALRSLASRPVPAPDDGVKLPQRHRSPNVGTTVGRAARAVSAKVLLSAVVIMAAVLSSKDQACS
jgi:hypothetical protein